MASNSSTFDAAVKADWQEELKRYLITGPGNVRILKVLQEDEAYACHPVTVPLNDLSKHCPLVLSALMVDPEPTLEECKEVVIDCMRQKCREATDLKPKGKVRFSLSAMPPLPEYSRHTIPRTKDTGRLLALKGTITKVGIPKMLEHSKHYKCNKCGNVELAIADYEQFYKMIVPENCPLCGGKNYCPISAEVNVSLAKDIQEVKLQEQVGKLCLGQIPRSISVSLEDDLVNSCQPGDDVTVIGLVKARWRPLTRSARSEISLHFRAIHLVCENSQSSKELVTDDMVKVFTDLWSRHDEHRLSGREEILASFCPEILGCYDVKLALAVALCGGVGTLEDGGVKGRGDSHLLLIGDPGTGKSQLLRYATKLFPRSINTNGAGSSSAGLTASAVHAEGEWQLQAGALVLADGGVCSIDEFSCMKESDRACIHEAMEQQSISVAKAGMVCKLRTKCTVLAAANPKGTYDPTLPLHVNTGIASPLLSRFDLVIVMLDQPSEDWDKKVSSLLLKKDLLNAKTSRKGKGVGKGASVAEERALWSLETMRAYFSYCKQLQPHLGEDAMEILSKYYKSQRNKDGPDKMRTTVRMLESMIRLAQGHARLVYREEVTIEDAVCAVIIQEMAVSSADSFEPANNPIKTMAPTDIQDQYRGMAERLLHQLGLPSLWRKEQRRLNDL